MHPLYQTVLLFGAPGAGKGTQGKILGSIPGFYHLSCGEVFRSIDMSSELGRTFIEYSSKGLLVPDDATVKMWHQNMHARTILSAFKPAKDLLVLDGIPRNVNQARLLQKHLDVFVNYDRNAVQFTEVENKQDEEQNKLKKLLNMSVNEIELSVRAANCLNNANITTVGQLAMKTEGDMLKYRNFGKKSLQEIKDKLQALGLGLGMTFDAALLDAPKEDKPA